MKEESQSYEETGSVAVKREHSPLSYLPRVGHPMQGSQISKQLDIESTFGGKLSRAAWVFTGRKTERWLLPEPKSGG